MPMCRATSRSHGPYLPAYLRSRPRDPAAGCAERDAAGRIQGAGGPHPDAAGSAFPMLPVVVTCRALDYVETLRPGEAGGQAAGRPVRQREYLHRYLGESRGRAVVLADGRRRSNGFVARSGKRAGGTWEQFFAADKMPDAVYRRTTGAQDDLWRRLCTEGWLPPLLALGRNPFMLVMLAQVYAARGGVLPQNRGRLFAAFVDTLLAREEQRCDSTLWPGADTSAVAAWRGWPMPCRTPASMELPWRRPGR
ncbi:MAG: hypothetical protein V9H69_06065 [Anaerolineae bacterium]